MQKEKDQKIKDKEQQAEKSTDKEEVADAGDQPEREEQEESAEQEFAEGEKLQAEATEAKEKYLRLYSEFENFRRRTAKERLELIGSATKDLVEDLIPVLDDFERALQSMDEDNKTAPAKEGTELIYNKFKKALEAKGLKKMEVGKGDEFDDDFHEAITQIPAEADLVGKIVDVVENGYFLNEKVVRFAKVVTGAKS